MSCPTVLEAIRGHALRQPYVTRSTDQFPHQAQPSERQRRRTVPLMLLAQVTPSRSLSLAALFALCEEQYRVVAIFCDSERVAVVAFAASVAWARDYLRRLRRNKIPIQQATVIMAAASGSGSLMVYKSPPSVT